MKQKWYLLALVSAALVCQIAQAGVDTVRVSEAFREASVAANSDRELAPDQPPDQRLAAGMQLTAHVARSHTRDFIRRPLTSVGNLLAATFTGATGIVKELALDFVLVPRLASKAARPLSSSRGMDIEEWENDLDRITGTERTRGQMKLLVDGEAFFDRLIAEIAAARRSIEIRTYIFDNDDYAVAIADLLRRRSREVAVTVMADGLGTIGGTLATADSQPADYVMPVSMGAYLKEGSGVRLQMLGNTWFMGDHTKTYIFDERVAFLGGMNIGREYRYDWHDIMVELTGPVVGELSSEAAQAAREDRLGDLALLGSTKRTPRTDGAEGGQELRLLRTRPHDAQIYRAQLEAIRRAEKHIFVQNAYLGDDQIIYELAKARRRGVDVRVILPARPDSELVRRSNALAINTLRRFGVRVYLYPGMTHVKAAIYDGWACFGTANFDRLSLRINKEVNIATSDPAFVGSLRAQVFDVDFARSREVVDDEPTGASDHLYERIVDILL
ncbi:MAG TPA: phosphatidylserine/phosphatidylglycerophosphate/cardiolipin synthase family protein [Pseudomonadales bacterium]